MNIENDFLTDFDLFGKVPELYYKGRSKKSSTFGIVLTVIYIVIYVAFLLYKLIRMFKRIDVTFYDSYTFKGIPSIQITNNEFYGGFGMGGIVDERMYYLTVDYVREELENGKLVEKERIPLETEICQLERFGSEYQEVFADEPLQNYYCIKDVTGLVLEGYSNLEKFSFFHVRFFPCVGQTRTTGEECYDYATRAAFFAYNKIELKIQDNDLNPEDFEKPVLRRKVDMNGPVFKDLYQLTFSYIQIVNIETDEDITGLNFFTDYIRRQVYTRYEESFLIASPQFYGDILVTGYPVAESTLQLAAKVLTEKRQYVQLIDVLGDVGGLMEILLTFLNVVSSFVTEVLYDRSLVNNLFSFDMNKKYVAFNKSRNRIKLTNEDNNNIKDLHKVDTMNLKQKFQEFETNKNIEVYSKENLKDTNTIAKNIIPSPKKKIVKKKRSQKSAKASKNTIIQLKQPTVQNEIAQNNENKVSSDENKNIISIQNIPLGNDNDNNDYNKKDLKTIYINNWLICCFWCTSKKRNVNRILFEEGSKILTSRLDIMNMFEHLYIIEVIQKKLGVEAKGINMSSNCKNNLQIYINNNDYKTLENNIK